MEHVSQALAATSQSRDLLEQGSSLLECPGFCGRVNVSILESGPGYVTFNGFHLGECQACPWGARTFQKSFCRPCTQLLGPYDYCFLAFNSFLPFFINGLFIMHFSKRLKLRQRKTTGLFLQIASNFIECSLALFCSLLIFNPVGELNVHGCEKNGAHEWYPVFLNPVVNYTDTLSCSSELVYPLYSMPFVIFAFCLLNLIVLRSIVHGLVALSKKFCALSSGPFYAALWTLPLLALLHAFLAGVLFYVFPHICLIGSLVLSTVHFAMEGRKTLCQLTKIIFCSNSGEHLVLIATHAAIFGFSIFSFIVSPQSGVSLSTSLLVPILLTLPVPTLFYIFTIQLTVPSRGIRSLPHR